MILMQSLPVHKPVLRHEAIEALNVRPGGRYVDCTLGLGGHALSILAGMKNSGILLGIDTDPEAIQIARRNLSDYASQVIFVNDNFVNLQSICESNHFIPVDGILFDLGVSSLQLDTPERGFSFQKESDLDMRFNPEQVLTAMDLVNILPEDKLAQLLWEYSEESFSRQIAHSIVENRPIIGTKDLAAIIEKTAAGLRGRIHPATKTFLALRIVVNHELENLAKALNQTMNCLNQGGRLVVISYHSLEDRIVKKFIKRETSGCICPPEIPVCQCGHVQMFKAISRKVIKPSEEEIKSNPRSRSARLRVVERL